MNWRPILLVVVLIGLGVAVYFSFFREGRVPEGYQYEERAEIAPGGVSPEGTEQAPAAKVEEVERDLEQEKVFVYKSTKLRNPMAPLLRKPERAARVAKTGETGAPKTTVRHGVTGIMWSPTNPMAIIDAKVMSVGDILSDGSVVTEIGRNYVALKRSGKMVRLTLR